MAVCGKDLRWKLFTERSKNDGKMYDKSFQNSSQIHKNPSKIHPIHQNPSKIYAKSILEKGMPKGCQKQSSAHNCLGPVWEHFHQKSKRLPKGSPNGGKSRKRGHQKIDAKIDVEKG